MFLAWDMLDGERRVPLGAAMGRLLERFSRGYLDNPRRGANAANNWNSHRAKLAALAAFALGDAALAALARGFAWIAPYAEGSKTHAEFKNSRVAFDKIRNDAGVAGFSGPVRPP